MNTLENVCLPVSSGLSHFLSPQLSMRASVEGSKCVVVQGNSRSEGRYDTAWLKISRSSAGGILGWCVST